MLSDFLASERGRTLCWCAALASGACQFPDYEVLAGSQPRGLPNGGAFNAGGAPSVGGGGAAAAGPSVGTGGVGGVAGAGSGGDAGSRGGADVGGGGAGGWAAGGWGSSGSGSNASGGSSRGGVGGGQGQSGGGQGGAGGNQAVGGEGGEGGATAGLRCADLPITVRSRWEVSASHSDANAQAWPALLLDNANTRWTTGKPQAGDEWLKVDFDATVRINQINLQQGPDNTNDYPRAYEVFVTAQPQDPPGDALATGSGESGVTTTIRLDDFADGRYLLVRQRGTSLSWWSALELEVSCVDRD